ncbi:MAG: T9SS type A sorting domain-containing protein [Candidatus Eisenbacteria bacterium]|uniref:T9SS type A sorting domain-containing protein n=1 Tax=Eiseniibacteriota bacterium TaxID=2212470 RepID=A0A948W672_UNCEI|nr:T9SS type A sorting domain-containing protein [Candidatus Eisenbacteria bacterium]MBU1947081.1 T9SS type A sorting domain-containing protein [Candidatus Eisenbacteria bacterium]MBU2690805.1 T9SS type A sorting domain-containing protein [Candidatus Eisenbacteria bacterium]
MRAVVCIAAFLSLFSAGVTANDAVQTDWCAGGVEPGPVHSWGAGFAASSDISWRSIPGQLALSSVLLSTPQMTPVRPPLTCVYGIYSFDFDHDGDMDIFGTTDTAAKVILWINQGTHPVTWVEQIIDDDFEGGTAVHPADFDMDGDIDLVGTAQTPGNKLAWWRNDGGDPIVWTKFIIDYSLWVPCNVFVADLDGDEDPDVISTSWTSQFIGWWRNDGGDPIVWTRLMIGPGFSGAHSAFGGDVDNDGDIDVVGTAANHNEVSLFFNEGGDPIVWSEQLISNTMTGCRYATFGDIDNDGLLDIVAAAWDGQLHWWKNGGDDPITWTLNGIDVECYGGHYTYIADIDGDGFLDVVAVGALVNAIYWYQNSGTESVTWTKHILTETYPSALTAFPADVDGDGSLEIIGSAHTSGEINWWKVTEFKPAGELQSSVLDLYSDPLAADIDWTIKEPAGTDLSFQVRSSDDPGDLGDWSAAISSPGDLTEMMDRYFQYKVLLQTTDPALSPVLEDFSIHWDLPADVRGENSSRSDSIQWHVPNPLRARSPIDVTILKDQSLRLDIIDARGRLQKTMADRSFRAGRHQIQLPKLASGVYFCLIDNGIERWSRRLVVVE